MHSFLSNEIIFSQCERKKRLIPNNINSFWNDVTDLLLVEHLLSGTSYIYNAYYRQYLESKKRTRANSPGLFL